MDTIEIVDRSRSDLAPVLLSAETTRAIAAVLPRHPSPPDGESEPAGTLRALHLDQGWLVLVEDGRERQYRLAEGKVFDDVVGPFVNRRVRLIGSTRKGKLLVEDILLAERDPVAADIDFRAD